jgi:hypothetical protein
MILQRLQNQKLQCLLLVNGHSEKKHFKLIFINHELSNSE